MWLVVKLDIDHHGRDSIPDRIQCEVDLRDQWRHDVSWYLDRCPQIRGIVGLWRERGSSSLCSGGDMEVQNIILSSRQQLSDYVLCNDQIFLKTTAEEFWEFVQLCSSQAEHSNKYSPCFNKFPDCCVSLSLSLNWTNIIHGILIYKARLSVRYPLAPKSVIFAFAFTFLSPSYLKCVIFAL